MRFSYFLVIGIKECKVQVHLITVITVHMIGTKLTNPSYKEYFMSFDSQSLFK